MIDKTNVDRNWGNFCKIPVWHTTMCAEEVEYLFSVSGGNVICNGRLRDIVADKITNNCFIIYTKEKVFA